MSTTSSSATSDLHKRVSIEPNTAEGVDPQLTFVGKENNPVTARVLQDGALSFETASGQLFTVSHGTEGYLFAVNDISGMPSIDVDSIGQVRLAPYNGSVAIGKTSATAKLDVLGNIVFQYAFNPQTGTTYSALSEDNNKIIDMSSSSANTVTLPLDSTAFMPNGSQIHVYQSGTGQTTVTIESGGTLVGTPLFATNQVRLRTRYSVATFIKRAPDSWFAIGDLSA